MEEKHRFPLATTMFELLFNKPRSLSDEEVYQFALTLPVDKHGWTVQARLNQEWEEFKDVHYPDSLDEYIVMQGARPFAAPLLDICYRQAMLQAVPAPQPVAHRTRSKKQL